tara:strand:- start:2011 stop:3123 length:1113 start_codon:yes stop_codon:yes gene_type:complete
MYKIAVIGQSMEKQNAFIIVISKRTKRRLSPNYVFLPTSHSRTCLTFYTGDNDTVLDIGVVFTTPEFNDIFYISSIVLYVPSDPLLATDIDIVTPCSDIPSYDSPIVFQEPLLATQEPVTSEALLYDELYSSEPPRLFDWTALSNTPPIQRNKNVIIQHSGGLISVINQQMDSTPGVVHSITVSEHTNYRFDLNGYSFHNNNFIIVSSVTGLNLLKNQFKFVGLPLSRSTVSVYFNSGHHSTILIGICFKEKTSIGQEFYLSELIVSNTNEIIPELNAIDIRFESLTFSDHSPDDHSPSPPKKDSDSGDTDPGTNTVEELPIISSIPQTIKHIEVEIFNLIESINDMNIDLTTTEKKLLKRISDNTKKSE